MRLWGRRLCDDGVTATTAWLPRRRDCGCRTQPMDTKKETTTQRMNCVRQWDATAVRQTAMAMQNTGSGDWDGDGSGTWDGDDGETNQQLEVVRHNGSEMRRWRDEHWRDAMMRWNRKGETWQGDATAKENQQRSAASAAIGVVSVSVSDVSVSAFVFENC